MIWSDGLKFCSDLLKDQGGVQSANPSYQLNLTRLNFLILILYPYQQAKTLNT